EVVDLALVVRVQDVVEREVAVLEPSPEAGPDRHDLRVVRHGTEEQRGVVAICHVSSSGRPLTARPTKSSSASVVGAMTRAARASRKRRSMATSVREVAPPHTYIARAVTSMAASAARALLSSTRKTASARPSPSADNVS